MPKNIDNNKTGIIKERLLIFDILRIISIFLIIIAHIGFPYDPILQWANTTKKIFTYYLSSGAIGVYLLVFVSGAVMQHAYGKKNLINNYLSFIFSRIARIYPAYWVTLLLCTLIAPGLILDGWKFIFQLTGFMPYLICYAWWIGLFVSLSIIFPFISQYLKKCPLITLIASLLITITFRIILSSFNNDYIFNINIPLLSVDRVFFLCLIFEFTLGMYLVEKNFFSITHNNNLLKFTSDLSYYIFLCHIVIFVFLSKSDLYLFWQPKSILYYFLIVFVFSLLLKFFDEKIQIYIKLLMNRMFRKP